MARVTKEKYAANREAILQTAGKLLREKGIDGVGVAEIAKAAGLTHGALYAHFPSKEALAAEAFSQGLQRSQAALDEGIQNEVADLSYYLDYLLSADKRDNPAMSCPMTASASEVGRQGVELSKRFAQGFIEKSNRIAAAIGGEISEEKKRQISMTIVAAEIGAMAVARAVIKSEPALSNEVLRSVKAALIEL